MGERSEVACSIVLLDPCQFEAWEWVLHAYFHQQEPFVVSKTDIVTRTQLLDHLALEQECLGFTPHLVGLEGRDLVDERARLGIDLQET